MRVGRTSGLELLNRNIRLTGATSNAMRTTPRLDLLFADAPRHLQSLQALINDPFVFESAEALLTTAQDSGVGGTEKLASATRPSKFVSML